MGFDLDLDQDHDPDLNLNFGKAKPSNTRLAFASYSQHYSVISAQGSCARMGGVGWVVVSFEFKDRSRSA